MHLFDNHTHTSFSNDSRMTMQEAVLAAHHAHLGGLAFTDHFDFDPPEGTELYSFDPELQQQEIAQLRGQIALGSLASQGLELPPSFTLLNGVEVGIQPQSMEAIKSFMDRHTFDVVIASLHFLDNTDPYLGAYYVPYDAHQAYGHYLETILTCLEGWQDFDILGHFDYVARYAPLSYPQHAIRYADFSDVLDALLRLLAESGKTFEINTKTYQRFAHGTPELDTNILKRFREFGGDAVSFGSDAHHAERVGEHFDYFAYLAQMCGFRYHVHYKNRRPVFLPF